MAAVMQHSCHCTEISMNEYIRLKGGKPLDDRWSKFIAEMEREKLSVVEQGIKHQKRMEQILRANKKLERPHVTTLQSRALLDYVNMERAEQLKVKHDMKEKWKKREMGWHELMLKDTKALIALENDKVKAEYQKRVELGRARKKQVEENHQRLLAAEEQKRKEKLELKAKAEEDLRQEQLQAEQKRQKIARVNKELVELNKELKQLLAERKQINYKETNEQKAKEAAEDALALQKAQRRQRDWELCDKSRQNQKEKEDEKKEAKQLQMEEDIDAIIQLNQDEEYLRNLKFD
ncbi:hypothetical protein CY35_15G026400 [Sphagnum magellanicum]|nr:hypothetical protein CY35_15G026400 [Sphagnum magellanicum]